EKGLKLSLEDRPPRSSHRTNGHSLSRHHRRPLYGLGDRLRVAEVVLLPLGIGANVLRRHPPGIVAKTLELATEMMCPDASLHPDQAGRHIGWSSITRSAQAGKAPLGAFGCSLRNGGLRCMGQAVDHARHTKKPRRSGAEVCDEWRRVPAARGN